ncbi:MAG: HAD-IB family hydrolase [Hyphomonas sp.]
MPATAIFDLDRTITRAPTWTRFLIFANRRRLRFWLYLPVLMAHGIAYKLGFASRDSVKVRSLTTLTWKSREELHAVADDFIAREVERGLLPGTVAAIRAHAARGDHLVIATASVDLIAEPLARALGFHQVIATLIDWSPAAEAPPPRLDGLNCYGAEKLRRINEHSFQKPVFAYSDHVSDLGMLLQADHAIAVNPSSGLRRAARDHAITVVDFETTDISYLAEQGLRSE